MALSLGVKVGSKIEVGKSIIEVVDIRSVSLVLITVDGCAPIVVSDQHSESLPDKVFVQTGDAARSSGVRLVFTAPPEVKITRLFP
jgi:hypothetical protein